MVMTIEMLYHELWVALRITATVLCVVFAGYFWNRRRHTEFKATRMILLGQGLFVLCFGLTRTLFIISDYFNPEFSIELVLYYDADLSFLFWKIATLVGILGIIFLLIVIESYLVRTRYIFTIIGTVGSIVALVSQDINFSRWTTYITLPVAMIGAIFMYFYLVYKETGLIRKKAGVSIVGLFLLGTGTLFATTAGINTLKSIFGFFPEFIPVIILTAGLAIYTYINVKE